MILTLTICKSKTRMLKENKTIALDFFLKFDLILLRYYHLSKGQENEANKSVAYEK